MKATVTTILVIQVSHKNIYPLGEKCVREITSVGANDENSLGNKLYHVTAYACGLSDKFSFQEDMPWLRQLFETLD